MAIGSVADFMYQKGVLKSARDVNASLAALQAAVGNDERYSPAQFEAALQASSAAPWVSRTPTGSWGIVSHGRSVRNRNRRLRPVRAVRARRMRRELGVSHVLLEAERHPADTIYKYQKGKHVMAEPAVLPLRSPLSFAAGTREDDPRRVGRRDREVQGQHAPRRRRHRDQGAEGRFRARRLADGDTVDAAETWCSRSACRATCASSACRARTCRCVQYQLDDPDEYSDETIVVVGAGDAAIENALALAEQNRVILINRSEEFARCKEGNLELVLAAIKDGRIECRYRHEGARRRAGRDGRQAAACFSATTPAGHRADRLRSRHRAARARSRRASWSSPSASRFPNSDPASVPQLSDDLRVERARPLHHRRARRLPADQAGDEPGLRGRSSTSSATASSRPTSRCSGRSSRSFTRARTVGEALALIQTQRAAARRHHHAAAARVHARQRDAARRAAAT